MSHLRSFNRFILVSLALLGLSVSQVHSALIESDFLAAGDGLLYVDTAANKEWVDATKTTSMSVNDFFNTSIYSGAGFQLADQTALVELYTNAGATNIGVGTTLDAAGNVAAADLLLGLMEHAPPYSQTGSNPWIHGYMDFGSATNVQLAQFLHTVNSPTASFGVLTGNPASWTYGSRHYAVGVWAYRDISPVPVPPAIWLFGTGILGLIGFSKRRKAA